ncbi:hypothetical protein RHMOL_Rhmol11G0213000 [Rhododendron molle]|uniref:Uncharacterized protein n=3 Tax=Rhododendron molle TaxID=49168 RepID=A0ACC0LV82_RHOML|nr:hypothetical protein RHMOL_Rhmol11G0213000 [Rhododendron molle]KAI8532412.1 hypothetical protein RHMOL_Rhmol11G0213000 [Rhododendron molle]
MVFVGFLKFAFKCFDLFAWPLFGLGCPLYASIRAIEDNSNSKMRNVVAYWILFSLVSLFELAFVKLTDRIPFWPYLKLMAMCLLVLPDFNGASYVYECLLRPCLSVDLRTAMKYLIKPKEDKSLNAENFLAVAERYVQENGSEALEKLLDRKSKHTKPDIGVEEIESMTNTEERDTAVATQFKNEEPDVVKVDARAVALPEKSPVAATKLSKVKAPHVARENANVGELKDESPAAGATEQEARLATAKSNLYSPHWQVKCVEPNLAQNEKKTVAAGEIKEKTVATAGGESKAVEIIDSEKVPREWTRAKSKSASGRKRVRRHKARELKASQQVNESEGSSSLFQSKHTKPDIGVEEIKEMTNTEENETAAAIQSKVKEPHVAKENANAGELKDESPAVATEQVKCVEPNLAQNEKKTVAAGEIKEKKVATAGGESKAVEIINSEKVQREWTCALCQVTTTSEKILDSHLQGRRHKAQELKASKQVNESEGSSSLFQSMHTKPDIRVEEIKEMTNTEEKETSAAIQCKVKEPHVAKKNANAGELKDESPAAATEQVKCVEPNLAQNEKKTVAAGEIKEKTVATAGGESKAVEIINSEKVQREWTCALCQVTTTSEKILDSHLQGRRHKAQELKASKQVNESEGSSSLFQSMHTKPDIGVEEIKEMTNTKEKETAAAIQFKYGEPDVVKVDARAVALPEKSPVAATKLSKVKEPHVAKENANAGELKDESPAVATEQVKCVEPNLAHNEKKTVAAGEIKKKDSGNSWWTFALCQVTTIGEKMLEYHLQGRRHKAQELKASKQVNESEGSSSLFQSKHTKPDIGVEEIKEMTITEEKETAAAIQSKCEEPNVGKVDARVVGLPEESPVAATKLSKVKEPHVAKENANVGEWKDENPAVATGEVAASPPNFCHLVSSVLLSFVPQVRRSWTLISREKSQVSRAESKYASIRAIENNSYSEMRNVVAYWILFSLVSLFELAFVKLIDWLPVWPYIKLLAMCLVVLPDFNGASYVYECLLRPCLSVDPRAAIKYFIKPKEDKNLDAESFLAAVDRYVQENGSEALEKLLDQKSKHTKPDIGVEVMMKALTSTEEKETAAAIQSKYEEPDVGKVDARAVELPEKSPVAATKLSNVKEPHVDKENANGGQLKNESPEVATEQSTYEDPNVGKVDARAVEQPEKRPVAATKLSKVEEPGVGKENANTGQLKDKNPAVATEQVAALVEFSFVKCVEPNLAQNEKKTVAAVEIKEKTVAAAGGENKAIEITDSEKVQREWACALCQVTIPSEKDLDSHLQGRKHKAKFKRLIATEPVNKNKGSSSLAASSAPENRTKKQEHNVQMNQTNEQRREKKVDKGTHRHDNMCNLFNEVVDLAECSQVKYDMVMTREVEKIGVGHGFGTQESVLNGHPSYMGHSMWPNMMPHNMQANMTQGGTIFPFSPTIYPTCTSLNQFRPSVPSSQSFFNGQVWRGQSILAGNQSWGGQSSFMEDQESDNNKAEFALATLSRALNLVRRPLFGLGCPLYASIRAIENNSNSKMRNLVAYWILFSLVSVFELAFVKLTDWLPFWPYLKVTAMCLLVLPDFNGASYVYECLLRPCLSVDLRTAMKYLIKPKEDKSLNAENFLAVAERYVQENGSEALEKLLHRKSKHTKPDIGVEEMKSMTNTEERDTAAATQSKVKEPHVAKENANAGELKDESPAAVATEQVKCVEPNLAHNEKKTVAAGEIKKKTVATAGGESKAVEITDPEKVKRVWTCALCQVTTIGERMLEYHLQGRRHKAQELKASKQVNECEGSSSLFLSKHSKPDIGVEEIKEMNTTEEKETAAAIQSKCEESNVGEVDARVVGLPEESPVPATKLSKVKEPRVPKENANMGEWKDENPAVATGEVAASPPNFCHLVPSQILHPNTAFIHGHIDDPKHSHEICYVVSKGSKISNHTIRPQHHSLLLQVKCVEPNLAQNEKNTVAAEEIEEKTLTAAGGENKAVKITDSEKVQREWTCALCQVTATSEKMLDSHLQGRKHKAQELKTISPQVIEFSAYDF